MKKYIFIVACLFLLQTLTACSSKDISGNTTEYVNNVFSYNIEGASAFTVNDKVVYAAFPDDKTVKSYDHNGNLLNTMDFGDGRHTNLSYYDEKIYSFTYGSTGNFITAYNLKNNQIEEHTTNIDINSVNSMTVVNDCIYMVYCSEEIDEYLESVKYSEDDNYTYMGEKAVCIDTSSFNVQEIDINNVINLKPYSSNEIIYYAYDDIGGYYFTIYNTATKEFSEKIYNNVPQDTFSFACCDDNIIYSDFSNRKLTSVSIEESGVKIDFMANVVSTSGNDLQMDNGECYVLDNASGNIYRTVYHEAVKENKEIKFCSSEIYSEVPYGCGYRINTSMLDDNEFALNILAENSDYDICMMSSDQTFSRNIRDKGAFYKLNDIPMVKDYLDACFPYIKDAAYDEKGNIWMIPIAVDIPCIVYNPANCEKNNIQLSKDMKWQELFEICNYIYKDQSLKDKFELNGYQAQADILNRYNNYYSQNNDKADYDNSFFREICQMIKNVDIDSDFLHTKIIPISQYSSLSEYYDNYLFELNPYLFSSFYDEAFSSLRAIPTPSLKENEPSCAECIYFCVNSNSDNLNESLNYISSYCSYMMGRNDNYMLKDESIYPYNQTDLGKDLYSIYSNVRIYFTPSYEMFWNDYIGYIRGNISLDSLVKEIERKTNMYINE